MKSSYLTGKLRTAGERVRDELLQDPQPSVGKSVFVLGIISGLVWILLLYIRPEQPWLNGKFLAGAICCGFWGTADMLPPRWKTLIMALRAAVLIFVPVLGVWLLTDLIVG